MSVKRKSGSKDDARVQKLQEEIEALKEEKAVLEEQFKDDPKDTKMKIMNLFGREKQLDRRRADLERREKIVAKELEEVEARSRSIYDKEKELEKTRDELDKWSSQIKEDLKNKQEDIDRREAFLKELKTESKKEKELLEVQLSSLKYETEQLSNFNSYMDEQKAAIDKLKKDVKLQLDSLQEERERLSHYGKFMDEQKASIQELQKDLASVHQMIGTDKDAIKILTQRASAVENDHAELSNHVSAVETRLQASIDDNLGQVVSLKEETVRIPAIEDDLSKARDEFTADTDSLRDEIFKVKEELESRMQSIYDALEEESVNVSGEVLRLEEDIPKWKENLRKTDEVRHSEIESLRSSLSSLGEDFEVKLNSIYDELEKESINVSGEVLHLEQEIPENEGRIRKSEEANRQAIESLKSRLSSLGEDFESKLKNIYDELEDNRQQPKEETQEPKIDSQEESVQATSTDYMDKLRAYIELAKKKNMSEDTIKGRLLDKGWPRNIVEKVLVNA